MRKIAILHLLLGAWLGGSIMMGAVTAYHFGGFASLFERNPKLAEQAGFAVDDVSAKKSSLLWVHSSELNRVFFEVWNQAQIALGLLALLLALASRQRKIQITLLVVATAIVALSHILLEPRIVELGRQLDFMPREPVPPIWADFQRLHGIYFSLEVVRLGLISLATLLLVLQAGAKDPAS